MLAGALCLLLFQAGFASFEFCLEKYGNLILADGILWRLNYFTSVRSRLTSAYNNNHSLHQDLVLFRRKHCSGPAKVQQKFFKPFPHREGYGYYKQI